MRKTIGVVAIIGLAVSLTWAADQVGGLARLRPAGQTGHGGGSDRQRRQFPWGPPGNEGILPPENATADEPATSTTPPELSAEVTSIEEDLARIEEALQSEEVLEEFTPSDPCPPTIRSRSPRTFDRNFPLAAIDIRFL